MKSAPWSFPIKRIAAALFICSLGIVISSQQARATATPKTRQTIEPSLTATAPGSSMLISQETLPTLPSSEPEPIPPSPYPPVVSPADSTSEPVWPADSISEPEPVPLSPYPPVVSPADSTSEPVWPVSPADSFSEPVLPVSAPGPAPGWENDYVLGPGDEIRIDAFGAPEYSGDFLLLPDGTISLPVTGPITLSGLTLTGAVEAISQRYAPYLRSPRVSLAPTTLRPVQITVVGEVGRPGSYTVPVQDNANVAFPRVTDALQLAGGITSRADVREIEVYRPNRFGQPQVLQVNLWELLQEGDMTNDAVLRSGDTVAIPLAAVLTPEEALELGNANFSPEEVTVYVIGEAGRSGPVQVTPNTPLNQVLLAAGGFDPRRADESAVGLIRLNPDGTVERREVDVDLNAGINEETNPVLREDDVIVVARSGLATFSDTVGLALGPIGRLLSTFFRFDNLFD